MRSGVVYFLCNRCGHTASAYRALANAKCWLGGAVSKDDALRFVSRMRCSNCLVKDVSLRIPLEKRSKSKVVATDRGFNRTYHRFECAFAAKINLEDLIEFESEDFAIEQAFVACGRCFKVGR